jgi:alkanesulfonate monooxygenase SsuD/methylene tetrahydromethanopterin reductase-like flavin-dependent oxidoreductase (luciferase family)
MAGKGLHERGTGASSKTATLVLALRLADSALTPEATPEEIAAYREFAAGRGLLNIKVSATETLDEALFAARELAVHAAEQAAAMPMREDEIAYANDPHPQL